MVATEAWGTDGVTVVADNGPGFDGDGDGMFLHSFTGRYAYQDSVARTETCFETQIGLDSVVPTGPPEYHFCVNKELTYFSHTGITFGFPFRVQMRNLSVAACYIIAPQFTVVRLITNSSSFTQAVP